MVNPKPKFEATFSYTLNQFLALATATNITDLLQAALTQSLKAFEARAGAIFFQTSHSHSFSIGEVPLPLLDQIHHWEQAVAKRLEKGIWRVLEVDTPSISTQVFNEHQLTLVNTPLLQDTQVVGSLSLVLPQLASLTTAQQITLHQLAQIIGQFSTLVSQLSFLQKQYTELNLLHQTSQILTSALDATQLLEMVIQLTSNVLDCDATSILLLDEHRQALIVEVCKGPHSQRRKGMQIRLDQGVAGWVATQKRPLILNDVTMDPRFTRALDLKTKYLTSSLAVVPLKLKGQVVGVLEALNKCSEQGFNEDDLRLMISIAAQVAVALENTKLYQNLRDERDKIINAQESERHALSRTLHDGTIQQLSAISMNLDYLKQLVTIRPTEVLSEIEKIQALAHKATKEARLLLFELRPIILESAGLIPALQRYFDQLNEEGPLTIESHLATLPTHFDTNIAGTIFSIVQEAVNNAKRHAKASLLTVTLSTDQQRMVVEIKDDGVGFDPRQVEAGYAERNSLGLLNMKERATLIDGLLTIESSMTSPMSGTVVTLTVPLKPGTGPLSLLQQEQR